MNDLSEMMFNTQRFQILALFSNPHADRNVSPSYAYAWENSVYPFLSDSAKWHQPYKNQFDIKDELLYELEWLLFSWWEEKTPVTFYDLEHHFGGGNEYIWNRSRLLRACRYICLAEHHNNGLWDALLSQCPAEAQGINRKFDAGDVYFE
jgi:hypothetical protein